MRWLRIKWHRWQARRAFYQCEHIALTYNCGMGLLEDISSGYNIAKAKYEHHTGWLKTFDPKYPR